MLKVWTQTQYGGGELDAGSTPLKYILARADDESLYVNNTQVYRIDVSCADPAAVLELTVGRTNVTSAPGDAIESAQPNYFRGDEVTLDSAVLSTFVPYDVGVGQPGITEVLGQYYVTSCGKAVSFTEPIESLRGNGTAHPQAFAYVIRRIDSETSVPYHLNVWFDEY